MPAGVPLRLWLRAILIRNITYFVYLLDHYFSTPRPPVPDYTVYIPSSEPPPSCHKGPIRALYYMPRAVGANGHDGSALPVVINFHGGGWTFGTAYMDTRWAQRVNAVGVAFVSVDYRLGPVHSYPVPIEDCIDAARWILAHAAEYNLDPERVALSGFSAGGNMVFSVARRLMQQIDGQRAIPLCGVLSFYPILDFSMTAEEKTRRHPGQIKARSIPKGWSEVFRISFLPQGHHFDLRSPDLSVGLAPDETLRTELPQRIGIWTCEWDPLLQEGEAFRKRLASLGKITTGRMIEEVPHAWDRVPNYKKGNPKMDQMYMEAVNTLSSMLNVHLD